jgi:hypothetical protein
MHSNAAEADSTSVEHNANFIEGNADAVEMRSNPVDGANRPRSAAAFGPESAPCREPVPDPDPGRTLCLRRDRQGELMGHWDRRLMLSLPSGVSLSTGRKENGTSRPPNGPRRQSPPRHDSRWTIYDPRFPIFYSPFVILHSFLSTG